MRKFKIFLLGVILLLIVFFISGSTTASPSLNYTLKIYGNANEDENINDLDISYVNDVIAGKKPNTTFADANNDGKINQADITQIQKIIDGTESQIIIKDSNDRVVSLPYPIQKVASLWATIAEPIQAIGAEDKIVAIDDETAKRTALLPEISKKESVGKRADPDIEKLVSLKPDFVISLGMKDEVIKKIEDAGIPVVISSYGTNDKLDTGFSSGMQETKQLGYLLGADKKADELINWYRGYLSTVQDKASGLFDSDRPKVMYLYDHSNGKIQSSGGATYVVHMIDFAGADDITSTNPGNWIELDPEYPLKENPEYILFEDAMTRDNLIGPGITDTSKIQKTLDGIKEINGFDTIDAVKNNKLYAMPWGLISCNSWLGTLYLAKLFHPEKFSDMNVSSIHQEYLENYLKLKPEVFQDSTFIYPKPDGF